jgi:Fe-S-cluster containining protein
VSPRPDPGSLITVEDNEARLGKLVNDLSSDPEYASGRRKFPQRVSLDDAGAIAGALQAEVDKGVEARAAVIASQGLVLACKRGCNGCCEEPIMIFRPEAARVARWLAEPENAAVREAFLAAYPAWKERVGDTPARLSALFTRDPGAYIDAHIEGWTKGVLCAFNRDGDCTIYPVRPITCRGGHALDTSEYCNGASTRPAARAKFVPLDQFIARTRQLLSAAHNAARGPKGRVEALCNIVHDMVTGRVH